MSDHDDAVAEGVLLLKTIGLDITYTDEGLEVIVRQIMRLGRAEALTDAADAIAGMRLVKEADHLTAVAARYERGFKDGLGAARDAVTAVPCNDTSHNAPNLDCPIWRNDALAAIDALARGKEGNRG